MTTGKVFTIPAVDLVEPYRWHITRDLLAEEDPSFGSNVGVNGPRGADPKIPCPFLFRMYDDDGVLYVEGRASRIGFEPLDDYGEGGLGCTSIHWWDPVKAVWEVL